MKTVISLDLRKFARDQTCLVRLPGCNGVGVVLAHFRSAELSGMGQKSVDLIGAHACMRCHDLIDGRRKHIGVTYDDKRLAHLMGVVRTLDRIARHVALDELSKHDQATGLHP
jgi:hypothetical protein